MLREKAFNFLSFLMFVLIIFLSINIFNNNYYFEFDKNTIGNFFSLTLNFNNIFKNYNNNLKVNNNIKYSSIEGMYFSNDNKIYSLDSGVIIERNDNKINILQNNGYSIVYLGTFSYLVNIGDYVEKNVAIALTYDYFQMYINNEGKVITYEEYIKNSF